MMGIIAEQTILQAAAPAVVVSLVGTAIGTGGMLAVGQDLTLGINSRATTAAGIGSSSAVGTVIINAVGTAIGTGQATAEAGTADPHFANVVLLLGFNGTDGATTTTDQSNSAHAMTFNGNAQIDTAQFKFGVSSLLLDGSGDFVTSPDHADWTMTGTFTGEAWVRYPTSAAGNQVIASQWGNTTIAWLAYVSPDPTTQIGGVTVSTDGVGATHTTTTTDMNFAPNTWFHIAWDRDSSNTLRFYVGGVLCGKKTSASGMVASAETFAIGATNVGGLAFNGWIDEVRLTKGVSRYGDTVGDSGFTPPTTAFARS